MRNIVFLLLAFFLPLFSLVADQVEYTDKGPKYSDIDVFLYEQMREGPDGLYLLDAYILPYFQNIQGKVVLDDGCKIGYWVVIAAKNGAEVYGIGLQKNRIEKVKVAIQETGFADRIHLTVGDLANLPYKDAFFDLVFNIEAESELPPTQDITTKGKQEQIGFGPSFFEMARVLKKDGLIILTKPSSYGVIFTRNVSMKKVLNEINSALEDLGKNPTPKEIVKSLSKLSNVLRATFVIRDNRLILITDESELIPGEKIWRKLPNLTIPNYYHSEEEYQKAFKNAGLQVEQVMRPTFISEEELQVYNDSSTVQTQLGDTYVNNNPFTIFLLKK